MHMVAATRGTGRFRGSFIFLLLSLCIILGLIFFNFEIFSTLIFPRFDAHTGDNASTDAVQKMLDFWSSINGTGVVPKGNGPCSQPCNCSVTACPPVREKIVVEEKIVEKIVQADSGPVFNQWWAEGKPWHTPAKFPLCSMDVCFNFSRCENMDELLVYHYDIPAPPKRYFKLLNSTPWYTSDPDEACLFFVFQDLDSPWPPHPNTLEHWNSGLNHVLITFTDLWHQKNPPEDTIQNASVLSSALYETTYRRGFDIGIPLGSQILLNERERVKHDFQNLKPSERKYFLTFRGTRYLGYKGEGIFRSRPTLRNLHNGEDVIVITSCSHAINDMIRKEHPDLGEGCDEDQKLYDQYTFHDLLNATFSLAPAGISGSSYRFAEVLSAGAIPVLIADNHVKPFEDLIQWPRCALQFPTSEMHRILPALRGMHQKEIEERQKYCMWVNEEFFKDDATLVRSVMRALKARFFGIFASFSEMSSIYRG